MTIYPIEAGNFKLDGGAMFGVVPKSIWQKTNPADSNNQIGIASRCLLIEEGDRLILVDTGMGNKQSEKFYSYYNPWGEFSLESSLKKIGVAFNEITDVFLTHLHFDHVGGATVRGENGTIKTLFPKANYWTNKAHWEWAIKPNPREAASFLEENLLPLENSGQLKFIKTEDQNSFQSKELPFGFFTVNGHTEKQMLPSMQYKGKKIVFMADLLPTAGHVPLPYVMGYDTRPLQTLKEKKEFLDMAASKNWYLFLEHDPCNQVITVKHTEKGVRLAESFTFKEIFN